MLYIMSFLFAVAGAIDGHYRGVDAISTNADFIIGAIFYSTACIVEELEK